MRTVLGHTTSDQHDYHAKNAGGTFPHVPYGLQLGTSAALLGASKAARGASEVSLATSGNAQKTRTAVVVLTDVSVKTCTAWMKVLTLVVAISLNVMSGDVLAQTPSTASEAMSMDEVAVREPRPCTTPAQPPYQGRSVWNTNTWPCGTVYYEFDTTTPHSPEQPGLPGTTMNDQDLMRRAMAELAATADVHFVVRTGQSNYLHIQNNTGNNSDVGMILGGQRQHL